MNNKFLLILPFLLIGSLFNCSVFDNGSQGRGVNSGSWDGSNNNTLASTALCSSNEWSPSGQGGTDCVACPSGSVPNANNTECICNNTNDYFNTAQNACLANTCSGNEWPFNGTCTQCPSGAVAASSNTTCDCSSNTSTPVFNAASNLCVSTTMPTAATPTFSLPGAVYSAAQSVVISSSTSGAIIYYTVSGSAPVCSSTATGQFAYSAPLAVTSTETIKAITCAASMNPSAVFSQTYTITLPTVATPTFGLPGGTYSPLQYVTITSATSGATIYYTVSGSAPICSSTATGQYIYSASGGLLVTTTETISAIACHTAMNDSAVFSQTYTITSTPSCGALGQPCCTSGTACNSTSSLACQNGTCVACGADGYRCCGSGSIPRSTGCQSGGSFCAYESASMYINYGECMPKMGVGDPCSAAYQCSTGICTSGICDNGGNNGGCFKKGTKVLTPKGSIDIEKIKAGDVVYSYDEKNKKLVESKVIKPIAHKGLKDPAVILILEDGTKLNVTTNHPFYSPKDGKYKELKEFKVGDKVLIYKDSFKEVAIKSISPQKYFTIEYNLELGDGPHNYLVDGVVVHNTKHV